MNIETVINNFETELRNMGLNDSTGALLVQLNIGGHNYIKSCGDLNNLTAPAKIISQQANNFVVFMDNEIALSTVRASTKILHYDTMHLIKGYSPDITLQELTSDYLQSLELYMREERHLSVNTIARHMKSLKRYVNVARKKSIISSYPFLNYTIRSGHVHRDALTERELNLLEKYQSGLAIPNEVLNAFLFSCYTGLRYSDVCIFTKQNIQTINHRKWLVIRMYKTNKEVRIPLSTIFEGRALQLTKSISRSRGILFHLDSNQQTNRVLKRIAKRVGIKEITFHTARHSILSL